MHDSAPVEDARVVDTGLDDANKLAAPIDGVKPLSCFARSPAGAVIGGAVGRTWGECCELQQLWVAREHRLHGIGSRLVRCSRRADASADAARSTSTPSASRRSRFYQALGYRAAHEIRGFPDGIVKYLMMRNVASDES